jgi:protein TonB
LPERLRGDRARRIVGILLALLVELLLVLILLTLKPELIGRKDARSTPVFTLEATDDAAPESPAPEQQKTETPPREQQTPPADTPPVEAQPTPPQPQTAPPTDAPPAPTPPPYILLPREALAQADIRRPNAPSAPPAAPARRPTYGPVDRGPAGPPDSEIVGRAPNGQPLYAAAWYREPYDDELRGYLSTASGPGWGLIACRTVPNYRVEDCVSLGESPEGSNIARSVLAAAWQFKVRPPRVGGDYKVGEWVRIRIDYGLERRRP